MKSDLCSVEPLLLESDLTFQYSLFVHTSIFPDDLTRYDLDAFFNELG